MACYIISQSPLLMDVIMMLSICSCFFLYFFVLLGMHFTGNVLGQGFSIGKPHNWMCHFGTFDLQHPSIEL